MKKGWKAVVAVLLSVWLFVMGFELGSYKEKKNFSKNQSAYNAAPVTNQTLPHTLPSTEEGTPTLFSFDDETYATTAQADDLQSLLTTMAAPETSATASQTTSFAAAQASAATTAAPTAPAAATQSAALPKSDPKKLSKDEVLKAAAAAMQTLKSEQNMLAYKTESTKIVLTECSAKAAVGLINKALKNAGINETITYVFRDGKAVGTDANGKAADGGKTVSPRDVIPPAEKDFAVSSKGAASATAKRSGNDIVYTIKLAPEKTTLQSPVPPCNAQAIGYVDFSKRELTGVTLEQVNITYPGSVITVTVGSNGKVTKLTEYLPLQGDGAARVAIFSGTAKFSGDVSATWTFSY